MQHFRALISQTGNQMTTLPVEWCPADPRQAHWHPVSFPPSEHRGQRGTWAREQRYIYAHSNLISSVSAITVHPAAAPDSTPGSLRPSTAGTSWSLVTLPALGSFIVCWVLIGPGQPVRGCCLNWKRCRLMNESTLLLKDQSSNFKRIGRSLPPRAQVRHVDIWGLYPFFLPSFPGSKIYCKVLHTLG